LRVSPCPLKAAFLLSEVPAVFRSFRSILLIIVVGLLVRFLIAPWTSCPYDVYPFYRSATDMLAGAGVYGHATFSYPPLFAVVLYPFVLLLSLFMDPTQFGSLQYSMVDVAQATGMLTPVITHPSFNLALKTPLILADLALGLLLYRFVLGVKDEKWARWVFILWFLNPLVIWTSSVEGKIDVFPVLMTLITLIAFHRKHYVVAGLALGLGVFFKLYPIYLIILYLALALWLGSNKKFPHLTRMGLRRLSMLVVGGLASVLVALPFFLSSDLMFDFIFRRTGFTSYGGLNLWFFLPVLPSDGVLPNIFPSIMGFPTFIFLLTLFLVLAVSGLTIRRSSAEVDSLSVLSIGNILVVSAVILLQPVTNPQHLLWVFPFLLLSSFGEKRWERKIYLLTVVGLLYSIWLQSAQAFLYPAAVYADLIPIADLNSAIQTYFTTTGALSRQTLYVASAMLGGIAGLTLLLPKRLDFSDRLWDLAARFRRGEA